MIIPRSADTAYYKEPVLFFLRLNTKLSVFVCFFTLSGKSAQYRADCKSEKAAEKMHNAVIVDFPRECYHIYSLQ